MLDPEYMEKILDKLCCDILLEENEELVSEILPEDFIHLMTIYNQYNYKRLELWNKLEILFA